MEFRIPELGEGIEQATVVRVLVAPGAAVAEGQDLVEVETEKSTMPIPAPGAGQVEQIQVKAGDKVRVGTVFMTLSDSQPADAPPQSKADAAQPVQARKDGQAPAGSEKKSRTARTRPAQPEEAPGSGGQRIEFVLPDLGEGIAGGTVVNVLVKPGDTVRAEQPLLELETEKASIPIPAPASGRIEEINLKPGQQVKVGGLLAVLSTAAPDAAAAAESENRPTAAEPAAPDEQAPAAISSPSVDGAGRNGRAAHPVPASPATRRLARELGVDLHAVIGTAPGGRVSLDDLKSFVRVLPKDRAAAALSPASPVVAPPLPDFAKYGPIEKKPISGLRKAIARNLSLSWTIAPQVTQHDIADVTELEARRKQLTEEAPRGTPKITMTVLAVRACVLALKAFPNFNASYDATAGENGELILKKYYNIGIAVDTERGLLVPVLRDADRKSLVDLAREMHDLADKARAGKLMPEQMRGGSFTITNLGGIGGTAFSPILNYPEVAILGLSRSSWQPAVRDNKIEPRLLLPLSLTYDHRVIDGADGARFCARLAAMLSDPLRLVFES
jgi:pyruvate dehydrogenase E2 component (dihydrolipoamide acetyltransferase)